VNFGVRYPVLLLNVNTVDMWDEAGTISIPSAPASAFTAQPFSV